VCAFTSAVKSNEVEKVRAMLTAHPELANQVLDPETGPTALMLACGLGDLAMGKALLEAGAENQTDIIGGTPLFYAAYNGHLDVVQWLVREGGAINQPNIEGQTPLWAAALEEHVDIVQWLSSMSAAALPAGHPVWERSEVKAALERGIKDRASAERTPAGLYAVPFSPDTCIYLPWVCWV
jgi:ankyrin repeat protein